MQTIVSRQLSSWYPEYDSRLWKPLGPPTNIRLLKKEKRLELIYGTNQNISLPAELLRVCSPSADTRRVIPGSGSQRVCK